ncbi:glucan endo-1 3-beta-glucosidase 2 [Prunus yedoensis var. nudiflora]|uniref:Glucan endo-1 3-beta-glucosidase 2 n=1 Tax=Prunus yedoensis var. nudiflora TaxID=2094558 RepID=A0A314YXS7_PRUYE|nr:glucan endo-1 3-beta-glucosidase 2 [Prunus yedoensis var. nudiflora]
MPHPTQVVALLKGQQIRHVRLYDADRGMLVALANTGIQDGADPKMLQAALDWACGPGKWDCSALLQGEPCYEPDNVIAHATYAFDTYHKMGKTPAACDFNGVAAITTTDPSNGSCIFPGSLGKNGTLVNITAPSLNSTSVDSSAYNLHSNAFTSIVLIIEIFISVAVFL